MFSFYTKTKVFHKKSSFLQKLKFYTELQAFYAKVIILNKLRNLHESINLFLHR